MNNGFAFSNKVVCLIIVLIIYNIFVILFLYFLGHKSTNNDKKEEIETNECLGFISNFKHKRRNLFQNFKFKIDCIFYSLIIINFINCYNNEDIIISFFIFIIGLKLINRLIIRLNKKNSIFKCKANYRAFFQKNFLYCLLCIVVILMLCGKIDFFNNFSNLTTSIFTSLFVWGLVEYMSFRYNVIRDVIKERDECYNKLLLNIKNKESTKRIIENFEDIGFDQNYYPLTTEYKSLSNKICRIKKIEKSEIIKIYNEHKDEKTEYWYYDILSSWVKSILNKNQDYYDPVYYDEKLKNIYNNK